MRRETYLQGTKQANPFFAVRQLPQGNGLLEPQAAGGARRDTRSEVVAQGEVLAEGVPCCVG